MPIAGYLCFQGGKVLPAGLRGDGPQTQEVEVGFKVWIPFGVKLEQDHSYPGSLRDVAEDADVQVISEGVEDGRVREDSPGGLKFLDGLRRPDTLRISRVLADLLLEGEGGVELCGGKLTERVAQAQPALHLALGFWAWEVSDGFEPVGVNLERAVLLDSDAREGDAGIGVAVVEGDSELAGVEVDSIVEAQLKEGPQVLDELFLGRRSIEEVVEVPHHLGSCR